MKITNPLIIIILLVLTSCTPYIKDCTAFPSRNNVSPKDSENYFENTSYPTLMQFPFGGMLLSQMQNYNVAGSCSYGVGQQTKKPIPSHLRFMDEDYPD